MGKFIKNTWYVAAWDSEVGDEPVPVRILGERIVLFRKQDGSVRALSDICPHRFAPMHRGKIIGDTIQCGYHGLVFDETGACARNPVGEGAVSGVVRLVPYPLVAKNTLLWIWMGDPTAADESKIPDFSWLDQQDTYVKTPDRALRQPIGYQLIIDNLLDLAHGAFLHPTTLGTDALLDGDVTVEQTGDRIDYNRWHPNGEPNTLFTLAGAAKAGEPVDFWNEMRWDAPSSFYLEIGVTKPGRPRKEGSFMGSVHILTPESETSTVYRWLLFRDFAKENSEMTKAVEDLVEYAFRHEDEPMLLAVQDIMDGRDFWEMKPLLLPGDKAAVLARRTLDRLVAAESAG